MNFKKITIYTPESPLRNPLTMFREMISDLANSRELAWQLSIRDIRAQYRQTFLGLLWAFILPFANTAAWLFIQRSGIVSIQKTLIPYPVYVFTGTIIWAIFIDSINAPLHQTTSAKPMLAKINFPREALVLSGIYQSIFNALIRILIVLLCLILLGFYPGWQIILIPFCLFSLILIGTAIGLLITPLGILYIDVAKGLPILMQFLMYTTPVVLPIPKTGCASILFLHNPLTPIIELTRNSLIGITSNYFINSVIIDLSMIIILIFMWIIYRTAMPILIERMSS